MMAWGIQSKIAKVRNNFDHQLQAYNHRGDFMRQVQEEEEEEIHYVHTASKGL